MKHPARRLAAAVPVIVALLTTSTAAAPQTPQAPSAPRTQAPPAPRTWWDSGAFAWMKLSAPCPNCDPVQTLKRPGSPAGDVNLIAGPFSGRTVLPWPLPAKHPATGVERQAPQPFDLAVPARLTWPTLHDWLSAPVFRVPSDGR